jgi:hypothetical protein
MCICVYDNEFFLFSHIYVCVNFFLFFPFFFFAAPIAFIVIWLMIQSMLLINYH